MATRSKYLGLGALVAGAVVIARRRRPHVDTVVDTAANPAHAPAHRHLPPSEDERGPQPLRERPWTKNQHGMRRPFSGD